MEEQHKLLHIFNLVPVLIEKMFAKRKKHVLRRKYFTSIRINKSRKYRKPRDLHNSVMKNEKNLLNSPPLLSIRDMCKYYKYESVNCVKKFEIPFYIIIYLFLETGNAAIRILQFIIRIDSVHGQRRTVLYSSLNSVKLHWENV